MTAGASLQRAREIIRAAGRIVVLTGAGVSEESGIPTFRGPEGMWRSHRAEDLATPEAFRRDPLLVWSWYASRRMRIAACEPNPAHRALARWALGEKDTTLVTQNVDGLHERAAREAAGRADPTRALPLELHGAILRDRCSSCGVRSPALGTAPSCLEELPRCETCGGLLRPDVVWFGEALDARVVNEAFAKAGSAEVCLVVGTSAVVYPAAAIPMATLESGGVIVEVNPDATPLTGYAAVSIPGRAAEVVPSLLD